MLAEVKIVAEQDSTGLVGFNRQAAERVFQYDWGSDRNEGRADSTTITS